jgi:hypothetical protein
MKKQKHGLVEQLRRRRYNKKNHMTLDEGVKKKKNHREFKNKKRWKLF